MSREIMSSEQKALAINLDAKKYGTFAEIGAGQEVARQFFQAGGASGTIAKSMSAYDMVFSDTIYGREDSGRYVTESRVRRMLDYEYQLLVERLEKTRGSDTCFFVFADTVATKRYGVDNECHGWLGIRSQSEPGRAASEVVIHIRLLDKDSLLQQQVLGVVGLNLIYAAFRHAHEPKVFIESLMDHVGPKRIEIDMVHFSGPDFKDVDNRLMSLELVEQGHANAVIFCEKGEVKQPADILYKKSVLIQRGSFRPITHVNMDMQVNATAQFEKEPWINDSNHIRLMEITLNNLYEGGHMDHQDFLDRVDMLAALGHNVLISNYSAYFQLAKYIGRYTKEPLVMVLGVSLLQDIFNEEYYSNLEGGILEAFGKLFSRCGKLYIYPELGNGGKALRTTDSIELPDHLRHLFQYLLDNQYVVDIENCDQSKLHIYSRQVVQLIANGDPAWESMVPEVVAKIIKERRFFGYKPS